MDDDDLDQLAEQPIMEENVISLDAPIDDCDVSNDDDGFFDTSGDDLSPPDLELADEEK